MKRKVDLSTTTSLTTTYAGEFAGQYISAALLSGKTLGEELITIKPNIALKEVIKKVSTNDIVKDASCDFDPTSTITLTERILQPEEFMVNLVLCKKDFIGDWESAQMGISPMSRSLPPKFSDFLIAHAADKVAQKIEQNIWNGTNANAGEFDGFKTTLLADSDVVDVSGTTSTASNIITELGKIADAIPSTVYGNEDVIIYLPSNMYRNYIRALGGFGASGLGAAGYENRGTNQDIQPTFFDGIKVVTVSGLASDTAVAAQKSNLFFGTGLLADNQEVKVIDMADIDGSQNVRVVMRFTAGIQHGIGSEVVLYS
tara:strand:+ start:623 stop:1567 length:945 start_codon:yes stop_codon:yes gene_type:complete